MSPPLIHHVKIGELKIAESGTTLKAILGSCIGIGLIWEKRGLYGLAHCLLPKPPSRLYTIGARYVEQAVPSLVAMMKIRPADRDEITAVVVGGGNMTSPKQSPETLVGTLNAQAALEAFAAAGIRISFQDTGGTEGRQIEIDCTRGTYHVQPIPRIAA